MRTWLLPLLLAACPGPEDDATDEATDDSVLDDTAPASDSVADTAPDPLGETGGTCADASNSRHIATYTVGEGEPWCTICGVSRLGTPGTWDDVAPSEGPPPPGSCYQWTVCERPGGERYRVRAQQMQLSVVWGYYDEQGDQVARASANDTSGLCAQPAWAGTWLGDCTTVETLAEEVCTDPWDSGGLGWDSTTNWDSLLAGFDTVWPLDSAPVPPWWPGPTPPDPDTAETGDTSVDTADTSPVDTDTAVDTAP